MKKINWTLYAIAGIILLITFIAIVITFLYKRKRPESPYAATRKVTKKTSASQALN